MKKLLKVFMIISFIFCLTACSSKKPITMDIVRLYANDMIFDYSNTSNFDGTLIFKDDSYAEGKMEVTVEDVVISATITNGKLDKSEDGYDYYIYDITLNYNGSSASSTCVGVHSTFSSGVHATSIGFNSNSSTMIYIFEAIVE